MNPFLLRSSLVFLATLFGGLTATAPVGAGDAGGAEIVEVASPSGARCRLATPAAWNGRLLLIAHGYIPAGRPLYAGFDPADPVYRPLLDEGWIVAATSYRRNGFLFREAAADVEELRALVVARVGRAPETVLVEGISMGGFVVALLAENPPHPSYRGALALGAALNIEQPGVEVPPLTARPRFPVLFLSNRDEAAGPTDYRRQAAIADAPVTPPAVWTVARDGHVNLNRAEVGAALTALRGWLETGQVEATRDNTIVPPIPPPTATFSADNRLVTGKVIAVDPAFGNLTVDLRPADLVRVGLKKGDVAALRFADPDATAAGLEVRVLLGTTFGDVPEGEWVCFPTADGFTLICRNFADAAASAGVPVGSAVTVRRP